jgi:AraC-like DNA-binding protein
MFPSAYATEGMLCLISATLCLLTGGILFLYPGQKKAEYYLGGSYFALSYAFIIAGLTYSRFLYYIPHLYRTGNICWLLCMPLSWLYVRTAITQKKLSRTDLIHFLPLALYLVDYFPFFMSSGPSKAAIFQSDIRMGQMIHYRQGWLLPNNSQIPIRAIQATIYWVLQVRLLASPAAAAMRKDRLWLRWMVLYNALQIAMFLPTLLQLVSGVQTYLWTSTVPPVSAGLLSALTLVMHPQILYGLKQNKEQAKKKLKPSFDGDYVQRLHAQLQTIMQERKPFLNPDCTLKELAEAVGVPSYKLSAYLNQSTGTNFSDYLNHWRIQYCLDLLAEKQIANLNLNGIATKCGFSNRNTFSTAFKKVTGKPPSEYLHMNTGWK